MTLLARLRRFLHCVVLLHRAVDVLDGERVVAVACECGREWR